MITALTLWLQFFKMSYTCARTCIFTACTAAAAGHIHAIHIRGNACIFSERTRLDYSNLFWIFERKREQEDAGQRTDGRGCHFGFTKMRGT